MTDYTPKLWWEDPEAARLKDERDELLEVVKLLLKGVPKLPKGTTHYYGSRSLNGDNVIKARELIAKVEK